MARYKIIGHYKYSKKWKAQGRNDSDVELNIDLGRFQGQYSKAQYRLDSMVMTSMIPLMPMQSGTFINVTKAMSAAIAGSGSVVAAAPPMGRFLYEGKGMVDIETGSPYARAGAKKVLVSQFGGVTGAKEDLTYGRPGAESHWFEGAKKRDKAAWISAVKRIAGGGSNG